MIENKIPMRPILRTPIGSTLGDNKKVSFEQSSPPQLNKGLIKSQIMRVIVILQILFSIGWNI